jgi:hypothetical protein
MATTLKGRNASPAAPYTSEPPKIFQVKSVPMATAVTQWTSMMKGGWIVTDTESRVPGGRVFRAQEKKRVWTSLGKFLHGTVSKEMDTSEVTETGNLGRKRRPDDSEEQRKVKRSAFTL